MTPAAAVTRGCTIDLQDGTCFTVDRVMSSTPRPGFVRWESDDCPDEPIEIRASEMVDVMDWPTRKDPMTALDVLKRGSRR